MFEYYFYTKKQAKFEIFEYIEFFYNRTSSHSYLGNLSPVRFEEINLMLQNEIVTYKFKKMCPDLSYHSSQIKIINMNKVLGESYLN